MRAPKGWKPPPGSKVGPKAKLPGGNKWFDFAAECEARGLPRPVAELPFAPPRKWAFDWAWPALKVALEVEGGAWTQGRHTRGAGFLKDMDKYNEASLLGWRLFRVTPRHVESGRVFELLKRAFAAALA